MPRRLLHTIREEWPRLALDVVVLVLGISLSFQVEQWRQARSDATTERRSWLAVRDDLVADTLALSRGARGLDRMTRACAALLGSPPADSVDRYMDYSISYTTFSPAASAFQEMRQTGSARQLQNRALFNALAALHSGPYTVAGHWDDIDEQLVLNRLVPYLEANAPGDYAQSQGGRVTTGLAGSWRALRTRTGYRNLLATSRSFKQAHQESFELALVEARKILARVNEELAKPM